MLSYRRSLMMAQNTDIEILGYSWQDPNPTILEPKEIHSVDNLKITTNSNTFTLDGITLRGIGDVKDRIYTDQGKVYLERKFGVYESLPTDNVTLNGGTLKSNGYGQFYFNRLIADDSEKGYGTSNELNIGLCSSDSYSINGAYHSANGDYAGVAGTRIWICTNAFEDASAFNEWLKTNKITIVYSLATPIIIELTGDIAKNILNINTETMPTLSDANAILNII